MKTKLINMLGFLSYFIFVEFKFSTSDEFFNFQILGFEDNSCVGSSLLKIYFDKEEIKINLLFLFHFNFELL